MHLSALERKLLNVIQEDIPLAPQPFKVLSKQLGLKEVEFLQRIKRLKERGLIHSFSAHLNHKKLGFESTLIALKVPLAKLNLLANKITEYPEVTHCYLRKGEYNLWVVFLYKDGKIFKGFLEMLTKKLGKENILDLKTLRQFKLETRLRI